MNTIEIYILASSIFLLAAYHFYLAWMIKHHPLRTDIGINACARGAWVRHMMRRLPGDVLAIQTLRNSLMSASFLASTAILLVAGLLSFILTSKSNLENFDHVLNILSNGHPHVALSRLLLLVVTFFFAFFNFILALRYYNHAGFLLNAGNSVDGRHALPEQFMIASLQRGAFHFTLGMRAFMFSLPFGLWLLGPVWLLLGSILLILVLWKIDFPTHTGIPANECFVGKGYIEGTNAG
jgi:uncharacterized membrane protein